MVLVDIRVPQLGEGLQEALVVALLKAPGDRVEKDEPIFEIETDKARVVVEAAFAGRLSEWLVAAGDVVPIGSAIGRIEAADAQRPEESGAAGRAAAVGPSRSRADRDMGARPSSGSRIPPRTRAHGRTLGLSEEELHRIPASSGKLLPQDVDRYLAEQARTEEKTGTVYRERRLSAQQRTLTFRFRRSAQLVIPATITCPMAWTRVERALQVVRADYSDVPVGSLEVTAYAVARAAGAHPNFRSVLVSDDRVREYPHLTLGVAVHRTEGDLVTAIVPQADAMTFPDFARAVQSKIALALEGRDQSDETTQMVLTYLGESRVTHGVPTLVAPAVATLLVGAPVELGPSGLGRTAALCLTFDHRLINGIEAAQFLEAVTQVVDQLAAASGSVPVDLSCEPARRPIAREPADALRPASAGDQVARVDALLRDRIANLMNTAVEALDFRRPLRSLGLTSLLSVALSKGLERDLEIRVPATLVWNYPTVEAISHYLAEKLDVHAGPASAPDPATDEERELERVLGEVEGLSDAEAMRLLTEEEGRGGARNG